MTDENCSERCRRLISEQAPQLLLLLEDAQEAVKKMNEEQIHVTFSTALTEMVDRGYILRSVAMAIEALMMVNIEDE